MALSGNFTSIALIVTLVDPPDDMGFWEAIQKAMLLLCKQWPQYSYNFSNFLLG